VGREGSWMELSFLWVGSPSSPQGSRKGSPYHGRGSGISVDGGEGRVVGR